MRINRRRTAISQSMDLFIIIAAVLGVGGVVSASVYNLVNSATTNSSLLIVSAAVHPGTGATATIAVKNDGGTSFSSGTATLTITGVTGTIIVTGASALAPGAQEVLTSSGGTGTLTAGSTVSLTVTQGSATQTIQAVVMSQ